MPNRGLHQLKTASKPNRLFLEHEHVLCEIWVELVELTELHAAVKSLASMEMLKDSVLRELHRIDLYKEQQWAQQQAILGGQPLISTGK